MIVFVLFFVASVLLPLSLLLHKQQLTEIKEIKIQNKTLLLEKEDFIKKIEKLTSQNSCLSVDLSRTKIELEGKLEAETVKRMEFDATLEAETVKHMELDATLEAETAKHIELEEKLEAEISFLTKCNDKLIADNKTIKASLDMHVKKVSFLESQLKKFYPYQSKDELECAIEQYNDLTQKLSRKYHELEIISSSPDKAFSYMAKLLADYQLVQYDESTDALISKPHPAYKEAQRIKELKAQTRYYVSRMNLLEYHLSYLYSLFPELENYIEYSDSKESPTESIQRIADEKWSILTESQKNQIVLDNYIKGPKSKWQIGRDYELYVGYQYSKQGYSIDYYGNNNGLEDLGRDLIIMKNGEIGIVQCKYWSSKKMIHEKHIAQLYGTVISYIIEHNYLPDLVHGIFITNITLSKTAKRFAEYLGIKYKENYAMGNFPRIKCNIGKDDSGAPVRIYHLPVDQQYDSVKIFQEGEFFAFTVEEAESKGFRRAYKWHSN